MTTSENALSLNAVPELFFGDVSNWEEFMKFCKGHLRKAFTIEVESFDGEELSYYVGAMNVDASGTRLVGDCFVYKTIKNESNLTTIHSPNMPAFGVTPNYPETSNRIKYVIFGSDPVQEFLDKHLLTQILEHNQGLETPAKVKEIAKLMLAIRGLRSNLDDNSFPKIAPKIKSIEDSLRIKGYTAKITKRNALLEAKAAGEVYDAVVAVVGELPECPIPT